MTIRGLWAVIAFFTASSIVFGQASIQRLGPLPGEVDSIAIHVSENGSIVVGGSDDDSDEFSTEDAVFWHRSGSGIFGAAQGLAHLPGGGAKGSALGLTPSASILLGSIDAGNTESDGVTPVTEPVYWKEISPGSYGPAQPLDLLAGFDDGDASGVSPDGKYIVGASADSDSLTSQATLWTETSPGNYDALGLGHLPTGGQISFAADISSDGTTITGGGDTDESSLEAAVWTKDTGTGPFNAPQSLGHLPGGVPDGGVISFTQGISADGSTIVGISDYNADGDWQGVRWVETSPGVFGDPQGLGFISTEDSFSYATGISGDGQLIVGESDNELGEREAFIWDPVNGMRSLQAVLADDHGVTDLMGLELLSASSISDDGTTIVGWGFDSNTGAREAWAVTLPTAIPVPEPTTGIMLLAVGGWAAGAHRRRAA
jgi:probable HAF family extracellular repeat protein